MGPDSLPAWVRHCCTVLCQKDPRKGNAVENYRPITCLPVMWKLLTRVIAEEMHYYLEQEKLLPEEQKGCRPGSHGTNGQLPIDEAVLGDYKERHTNLSMALIEYKKANDFILHSCINECMELFGIADNMRNFLEKIKKQWKLSMTSNGEDLGEVDLRRGIFRGDNLSPQLLFFEYGTFVVDTWKGKRKL